MGPIPDMSTAAVSPQQLAHRVSQSGTRPRFVMVRKGPAPPLLRRQHMHGWISSIGWAGGEGYMGRKQCSAFYSIGPGTYVHRAEDLVCVHMVS